MRTRQEPDSWAMDTVDEAMLISAQHIRPTLRRAEAHSLPR